MQLNCISIITEKGICVKWALLQVHLKSITRWTRYRLMGTSWELAIERCKLREQKLICFYKEKFFSQLTIRCLLDDQVKMSKEYNILVELNTNIWLYVWPGKYFQIFLGEGISIKVISFLRPFSCHVFLHLLLSFTWALNILYITSSCLIFSLTRIVFFLSFSS